jgi:hypothetical protein
MGHSVRAMEQSSDRIKASLHSGFPKCPAEGVEYHHAVGDSIIAQNTAIASITAWNQKHVARALEVERSNKRRATDNPDEVPTIDYQGVLGHLNAKGKMGINSFIKALLILAVVAVAGYGFHTVNKAVDKINTMKTIMEKAGVAVQ